MTLEQAQLPLVLLSGILGSAHCIGMCGAIAATMSAGTTSLRASLARQIWWSLGRTSTYTFLGVIAAAVGARFVRVELPYVSVQAVFAIIAGTLLVAQGLLAAGWWPARLRRRSGGSCVAASVMGQFLRGGSSTGAFVAGILTGFLPCGLVYSFLALSASSAHPGRGALIMLVFGAGTVPVMLATGVGVSLLNFANRRRLFRIAACCVLMTGLLTLGRGVAFARSSYEATTASSGQSPQVKCPLCHD
ncbi:MAG: sulfite exporter TauE/SafE family protein [Planctomycetaceae bacterium]|nr:sulfite exporter TauE/SafE family protein [Planctomycetaceae bacterium]